MKVLRLQIAVPILAAALAMLPYSAGATPTLVDGSIADWDVNMAAIYGAVDPGLLAFTPTAGGYAVWVEDSVGTNGYVGPGYGGQNYDLEAMYAYYDNTSPSGQGLYLAVVTGFDRNGVANWGGSAPTYLPGDLFLDFGSNGSYDLAIETNGNNGYTAGHVYVSNNTLNPWFTSGLAYTGVAPNQIRTGAATDLTAASTAGTAFAYSDIVSGGQAIDPFLGLLATGQWDNQNHPNTFPYASTSPLDWNPYDHNVIEVYLSEAWLTAHNLNGASGVNVRSFWTEDCGNDYGTTPQVTVPPVPEPITMIMLGCMGAGMLGARRIKHWKSEK
ncbi:MAG: hypothetical protein HZB26_19405 [Candidatus Hydrogenedentes bacterium]|nr:hypothetical protein [Candidatus Hydrogenedentota bacterium]